MASKDRTGEQCPSCGKGKLYPTGKKIIQEPSVRPESGEYHREYAEYECDICHQKAGAHGIGLGSSIKVVGTAKVEPIKPKKDLADEK